MNRTKKLFVLAVTTAFTQFGCGGGGGGTPSIREYQGFYEGKTPEGTAITAAILDDGSFYAVSVNKDQKLLDVSRGTVTGGDGNISSSDILDYRFNGRGMAKGQLSASYKVKQSLAVNLDSVVMRF